jgi:hypothetical protein
MLYQYHAQRFRRLQDGRAVGTVSVGDILYLQNAATPFLARRAMPMPPVRRNPWRVEAWLNRTYPKRTADGTFVEMKRAGGHLAQVRSLRDGRTIVVSDWLLLQAADAGLCR